MRKSRRRQKKQRRTRRRTGRRTRRRKKGGDPCLAMCMEATDKGKKMIKARLEKQACMGWMPDKTSKKCQICNKSFSILSKKRRRHHCRSCGRLVCGEHSDPYKIKIFAFSIPSKNSFFSIRSCSDCAAAEKELITSMLDIIDKMEKDSTQSAPEKFHLKTGSMFKYKNVSDIIAALRQAMMEDITDSYGRTCYNTENIYMHGEGNHFEAKRENQKQSKQIKECVHRFCAHDRYPNYDEVGRALNILQSEKGPERIFYPRSDIMGGKIWEVHKNLFKKKWPKKKKKKSRPRGRHASFAL